ncbi:hypothetical protein CPB84DRAFT_521875 [Gymnopilus junonius]|uniref:Uncharacterized protein n=1 Tax=Gymnopilus junonius TaxID=109634 RepID=A0A9P5P113_GYMJU|nr:hypothetical protein CPB84DRAFT_521875 [Gymnopilus junonius]
MRGFKAEISHALSSPAMTCRKIGSASSRTHTCRHSSSPQVQRTIRVHMLSQDNAHLRLEGSYGGHLPLSRHESWRWGRVSFNSGTPEINQILACKPLQTRLEMGESSHCCPDVTNCEVIASFFAVASMTYSSDETRRRRSADLFHTPPVFSKYMAQLK